ncbi:MAG: cytochrome c oxidase subunit 3 [Planctomycetaceae bacterium]|nr:cytochrome c oxidase subunit 3 [Planctomycetaceae bacterium]
MSNVSSPSTDDYWLPGPVSRQLSRGAAALRLFALSLLALFAAGGISWLLMRVCGRTLSETFHFPLAFAATTPLLLLGSLRMAAAVRAVRREKQSLLRRRLHESFLIGTVFMGVQTYALWTIVPPEKSAYEASAGVAPFVLMLAALHGLHFLVATLFLSYVSVQAQAGRYDHEYYWGVSVCAWFWHALGIVWLAILVVYSIAAW